MAQLSADRKPDDQVDVFNDGNRYDHWNAVLGDVVHRQLLRELKAIGAHTVKQGARGGLMGKATWRRLTENYERFRQDGRLPATYEVVYGHAWAGSKDRLDDGRQIIQLKMASPKGGLR